MVYFDDLEATPKEIQTMVKQMVYKDYAYSENREIITWLITVEYVVTIYVIIHFQWCVTSYLLWCMKLYIIWPQHGWLKKYDMGYQHHLC